LPRNQAAMPTAMNVTATPIRSRTIRQNRSGNSSATNR
jgi:hypothetical protein